MKVSEMPGVVPPVLVEALSKQDDNRRSAFIQHLLGGTSANYLSDWLRRAGTPVSATQIKVYRRSVA